MTSPMKNHLLSAALAVALPIVASADIERTVEKSFPVSPGQTLRLNTFSGGIEVTSSNEAAVKIVLLEKIDADSEEKADEILAKMELKMEANGEGVFAEAKLPTRHWAEFSAIGAIR